jgi:hypothetical protein
VTALKYTFKSDVLFKMVFIKYPDLLKHLVATLIGIEYQNIKEFEMLNTEMPPEQICNKFCRLDLNLRVNGRRIDLEIHKSRNKATTRSVPFYTLRAIFRPHIIWAPSTVTCRG